MVVCGSPGCGWVGRTKHTRSCRFRANEKVRAFLGNTINRLKAALSTSLMILLHSNVQIKLRVRSWHAIPHVQLSLPVNLPSAGETWEDPWFVAHDAFQRALSNH